MQNKSMVKLRAILQYYLDCIELGFDFRDFYLAIFGFYLFQAAAYVLAYYAQQHSKFLILFIFLRRFNRHYCPQLFHDHSNYFDADFRNKASPVPMEIVVPSTFQLGANLPFGSNQSNCQPNFDFCSYRPFFQAT